jgi:hypothetical protein
VFVAARDELDGARGPKLLRSGVKMIRGGALSVGFHWLPSRIFPSESAG